MAQYQAKCNINSETRVALRRTYFIIIEMQII